MNSFVLSSVRALFVQNVNVKDLVSPITHMLSGISFTILSLVVIATNNLKHRNVNMIFPNNPFDNLRRRFKPGQQVYIDFPADEDMPWTAYEGSATLVKCYKKTWIGKGEHWLVKLPKDKVGKNCEETFFPLNSIYPSSS